MREPSFPPQRPRHRKPSFPNETWPCKDITPRGLFVSQRAVRFRLERACFSPATTTLPQAFFAPRDSAPRCPRFSLAIRFPKGGVISTRESLIFLRNDHAAPSLLFPTRLGLATPTLLVWLSPPKERCDFDSRELAFLPQRPHYPKPSFPHETWPCDTNTARASFASQRAARICLVRESRPPPRSTTNTPRRRSFFRLCAWAA